jgi:hypothetical protein
VAALIDLRWTRELDILDEVRQERERVAVPVSNASCWFCFSQRRIRLDGLQACCEICIFPVLCANHVMTRLGK